ncbi:Hsp20/alpha crystallin family protein [bacterium]|nr:MAG: Hsp20/alpha crystallin family protein [bacterium]
MARREIEELYWVAGDLATLAGELAIRRPRLASSREWEPRVDLIEEAHRFLIKAELAGVRTEDLTLQYNPENHAVVLRGIRLDGFEDLDPTGVHQLEISTGEFSRSIRLPDQSIDPSGIRAQFRNGMLFVMVPKMSRVTVMRTVVSPRF